MSKFSDLLGKAGEKAKELAESGVEKTKELAGKSYAKSKEIVYEKKKELVLDYLKDVQKDESLEQSEKKTLLDARHIVSEISGEPVNPKDLVKGKKYNYTPEPGDKIKFKEFSNNQYFFKDKKGKLLSLTPSELKQYVFESKKMETGGEIEEENTENPTESIEDNATETTEDSSTEKSEDIKKNDFFKLLNTEFSFKELF